MLFNATIAVLLVLCSLLVHEAGHWALLRRYAVPVHEIWLGLGPVLARIGRLRIGMLPIGASLAPDAAAFEGLPARQRVLVALAGPLASAIYASALLAGARYVDDVAGARGLEMLGQLNLLLAMANVLPIPPLDGWHAYAGLSQMCGHPFSDRSKRLAYRMGNGLVYGIGFLILGKVFFHL